jgi:hypothetical protein
VLPLGDQIEQIVEIGHVLTQRPRGDLAMQDLDRNVGAVGRDLAPAL